MKNRYLGISIGLILLTTLSITTNAKNEVTDNESIFKVENIELTDNSYPIWVWCGPNDRVCGFPHGSDCGDSYDECTPSSLDWPETGHGYYCLNGDEDKRSGAILWKACCTCKFICDDDGNRWECIKQYDPSYPPPPPPNIFLPIINNFSTN